MIIPSGLKTIYNTFADTMIDNDMIGQTCTLYFPGKQIECPNCIFSGGFGGAGSNVYKTGGPAPFTYGNCPLCNGKGKKEVEVTASVRLRCYFNKKDWRSVSPNIQIPDATMMTIGYLTDLPNIKSCSYIEAVNKQTNYLKERYKLAGEPHTHGFYKDRYFIAYWMTS